MLYHLGPNPTSDIIVVKGFNQKSILLIRRSKNASTEAGKLALPGGFVDTEAPKGTKWKSGKETSIQAAKRELLEETGLNIYSLPETQFQFLGIYDDLLRDPRNTTESWIETHVFSIQLPEDFDTLVQGSDDAEEARWISLSDLKNISESDMAFDHFKILKDHGFMP